VFGAPNVSTDSVRASAQQMSNRALSDPKSPEAKAYVKAIKKVVAQGFGTRAFLASQVDPSMPPHVFITGQPRNQTAPVRIAVPVGNDYTRLTLYGFQKNVPFA